MIGKRVEESIGVLLIDLLKNIDGLVMMLV